MFTVPATATATVPATAAVAAATVSAVRRANTSCAAQTRRAPGKHAVRRANTSCAGQTRHAPGKHAVHRANTPRDGQTRRAPGKHVVHRANTSCVGQNARHSGHDVKTPLASWPSPGRNKNHSHAAGVGQCHSTVHMVGPRKKEDVRTLDEPRGRITDAAPVALTTGRDLSASRVV